MQGNRYSNWILDANRKIKRAERAIDAQIDSAMREAVLPIADEMSIIFQQQEDEVTRNLDTFRSQFVAYNITPSHKEQRAKFLTADGLLDFARWTGETAQRVGGYARDTMQSAWCVGLSLLGRPCDSEVIGEYVSEVIDVLRPMNENITATSKRKIEELVREAIEQGKTIEQVRTEFFELFGSWKRTRSQGVGLFNVTYPFNNSLFRLYYQAGIEYKQWVTQGDSLVRNSHKSINGKIVRLQESFNVNGALMLYPGDISVISSHPGEIYGCRCAIKPVLDPRA